MRAVEKKEEGEREKGRKRNFAGVDLKKKRRSLKVIGGLGIEDVRDHFYEMVRKGPDVSYRIPYHEERKRRYRLLFFHERLRETRIYEIVQAPVYIYI